eukprot:SAG11_NODE_8929_length_961_cov_1.617169_1_plen_55_part_01
MERSELLFSLLLLSFLLRCLFGTARTAQAPKHGRAFLLELRRNLSHATPSLIDYY